MPTHSLRKDDLKLIDPSTLAERIVKQLKTEEFMIGAKCLWENLVGGKYSIAKKLKIIEQQEKEELARRQKQVDPEVKKKLFERLNQEDQERKLKKELISKFRQGLITWEEVEAHYEKKEDGELRMSQQEIEMIQ